MVKRKQQVRVTASFDEHDITRITIKERFSYGTFVLLWHAWGERLLVGFSKAAMAVGMLA